MKAKPIFLFSHLILSKVIYVKLILNKLKPYNCSIRRFISTMCLRTIAFVCILFLSIYVVIYHNENLIMYQFFDGAFRVSSFWSGFIDRLNCLSLHNIKNNKTNQIQMWKNNKEKQKYHNSHASKISPKSQMKNSPLYRFRIYMYQSGKIYWLTSHDRVRTRFWT